MAMEQASLEGGTMGKFAMFDTLVHLYDTEAISASGGLLHFKWQGRMYDVPKGAIMASSAVWQAQQTGTLMITREAADTCGVLIVANGQVDVGIEVKMSPKPTCPVADPTNTTEIGPNMPLGWPTDEHTVTRAAISAVCNEIRDLLLSKNSQYGNSALEPVRFFSRAGTVEQLLVRIDDKLARLQHGGEDNEDAELDLLGYFVLLRIARQRQGQGNGAAEGVATAMTMRR